MRSSVAVFMFILIYSVYSKSNTKALTESMGQEVIEIGNPLKELPPDLDEEPSAEVDDDDDDKPSSTTTAATVATVTVKKDVKTSYTSETPAKLTTIADGIRRKGKDPSDRSQEEEEAKIEKELAEIYKDTEDYKADSAEGGVNSISGNANNTGEKSALRSKTNFKFQPDRINQREVERFRTSVDEISCDRSVTKKMSLASGDAAISAPMVSLITTALALLSILIYTMK